MTVTWNQVHADDTLRGTDGGAWVVAERTPGPRWVVAGAHDHFTLRCGEREVRVTKKLIDPAPLARRADHSSEAAAWQALSTCFQLEMIKEGPMTDAFSAPADPDAGVKFDRYRRYILPHPTTGVEQPWTRVTTLARTLADEYGLNQWAKRNVAKGMALRPDLIAGAAAADPEEDKSTLESIVAQAEAAAGSKKGANFGTAFHQAAKRLDQGESLASMTLPAPLDRDLVAYADKLCAANLTVVPEYMERVVCCLELGVCGTLDRILRQPPGVTKSAELTIGDLKSAKEIKYSWLEIQIQLACYAHATHMWDRANKCWLPMPEVDQYRALVIWAPIGKAHPQVYGVDLVKGWRRAQLAAEVREVRKEAGGWLVAPHDPKTLVLQLVSQAADREALAKLWERYHTAGMWTDDVMAVAQERLAALENR